MQAKTRGRTQPTNVQPRKRLSRVIAAAFFLRLIQATKAGKKYSRASPAITTELMTGGLGFVQPADKGEDKLDSKVERMATEAAKRKFSPEFMNRLDKVVVFHPLRPEQLEQILEIELGMVQQRVLETARGQCLFRVAPGAR